MLFSIREEQIRIGHFKRMEIRFINIPPIHTQKQMIIMKRISVVADIQPKVFLVLKQNLESEEVPCQGRKNKKHIVYYFLNKRGNTISAAITFRKANIQQIISVIEILIVI